MRHLLFSYPHCIIIAVLILTPPGYGRDMCAKRCPVQAIDPKTPGTTDTGKCISCMRCVSLCPQKARKVSRPMAAVVALAIKKACSERKKNELFI